MPYLQYTDPRTVNDVLAVGLKSSFSDSGGCVVPGLCSHCPDVHFYDSKRDHDLGDRTPIFAIQAAKWRALVAETQRTGILDPVAWFCSIAERFTPKELKAFRLGVLDGQFNYERLEENLHARLDQPELVAA
ncbi:MAG TPA: hypothetical protein VMT30_06015 [Candidatus Saccharimonadia bacterium]|nr:hypothetical protein [Candidatus Saccharimonadia bacterium]